MFQILKQNYNCISFEQSKKRHYTQHQRKIMKEMKKIALNNEYGWLDIYTGQPFSAENPPSIEHLISYSAKNSNSVKNLEKDGFEIHGLDNIFPVGSLGNSQRKSTPMQIVVSKEPIVFQRLIMELKKYAQYKSDLIDGKYWVNKLVKTLETQLQRTIPY